MSFQLNPNVVIPGRPPGLSRWEGKGTQCARVGAREEPFSARTRAVLGSLPARFARAGNDNAW